MAELSASRIATSSPNITGRSHLHQHAIAMAVQAT